MTRGEPSVDPQGSCTAQAGTWNTANWTFSTGCTLTIDGGASGDTGSVTSATAFGNYRNAGTVAHDATDILIKGSLTIRTSNAFNWPSLIQFRMGRNAQLILTGNAGYYMFAEARLLVSVDTSGWDLSHVSDIQGMFYGCNSLASLSLPNLHLADNANLNGMLGNCSSLARLDIHGWHVGNIIGFPKAFDTTNLPYPPVRHFTNGFLHDVTNLKSIDASGMTIDNSSAPDYGTTVSRWIEAFHDAPGLQELNLANLTVTGRTVTDLDGKIYDPVRTYTYVTSVLSSWPSLQSLDVTGWDVTQLNLTNLFLNDPNLTAIIGLKDWDTSNATSMWSMFSGDASLASVDVSHFDTRKVANFGKMFYGCHKLVGIDVTGFNTSQATNMSVMFYDCPKLTVLDPSGFDMHGIQDISGMFQGDTNLKELDLSGWDLRNVTNHAGALPSGLRMLALGANTRLYNAQGTPAGNPFASVNQNINWVQMQSFQPGAPEVGPIGNTAALTTRAASANPAGFYTDSTYVGATLVADANGGAGSYYTDIDTTSAGAALTAPAATVLTGHRAGSVFTGWNTDRYGRGTPYRPGQQIASLTRGEYFPHQTITLYAQWRDINPPGGLTATYHHTGDTIQVSGTLGHDDPVTACLNPTTCQTATTAGGTWTVSFPASTFTGAYPVGAQYSVAASSSATDPITHTTVTSPEAKLTGTLPWTTVTLAKDGASTPTGTVPDIDPVYTDTGDGKAYVSLPRLAATGGISVAGGYLTGWNHLASQSTPEFATPGATTIPATDGTTDSNGHTSVTLHPVWNILNAPTGTGQRSPADNGVRFTATGKPWTNRDTITLCVKPHTQAAYTDCTAPKTTSDWDGISDYTINHDYTKEQLPQGGDYDIKTTLTTLGATDIWRGDGTTQTGAITKTSTTTTRISGIYLSSLPLTGGQPQRLVTFLAAGLALALLLLAAADRLRHQRQANARHSR
ncbi:BspA family leucine-rich repeat surface protein [Bifidobacterium sp. ESL0775]|uniref:BspA family leucine-rich repeat surface protein n=1 Tax=Bifidobacterium sp. ESL0775 TaxID=2983230 RepID=UPI0023F80604|nr:BspA family leucine-rich repeat surface protein [Bifidobacterium sp. ESL0775]WEV69278.1 BspA family leucine-rich repeat surface protein [Bifidobacterium sp. ESL0775]